MIDAHLVTILILSTALIYCHCEDEGDEVEPDEYALNDDTTKEKLEVILKRTKRHLRWHSYGYSTARNGRRNRNEQRFRVRARYRPMFSKPPSPAARRPVVRPSSSKPSSNPAYKPLPPDSNPDVNKPGITPFNHAENIGHRQNHFQQSSSNPGAYPAGLQQYNPNMYRPPVNQQLIIQQPNQYNHPPPPVIVQQPNQNRPPPQQSNQGSNSRMPLPIPIPIPIPLGSFGDRSHGEPKRDNGHNGKEFNETAHNQSSVKRGRSIDNRYQCCQTSKQLIFTIINVYLIALYYLV